MAPAKAGTRRPGPPPVRDPGAQPGSLLDRAKSATYRAPPVRWVLEVLPKRLARFGLTVHPDKMRLVAFRPRGPRKPDSFTFLRFTH